MAKPKRTPVQQEQYEIAQATLRRMTDLGRVATFIKMEWPKPYFGAVPYLEAMSHATTFDPDEPFIYENQRTQVVYFLANASTWRGPVAQATKEFLDARYGYGKERR